MAKKSLKVLMAEHTENVSKGCTCPPPSQSNGMMFKPRSVDCPMHGELATS